MRICSKCGLPFSIGKYRTCKPCKNTASRTWNANNRDRVRTTTATWYEVNKDRKRAKVNEWISSNREMKREQVRRRAYGCGPRIHSPVSTRSVQFVQRDAVRGRGVGPRNTRVARRFRRPV